MSLNYLDSLTGKIPRRADQTVNFGRLDWQRKSGSRMALEYNRVRWSGPGAGRSGAVVDRGVASVGSSYGKIDAGLARWVQFLSAGLSNEVRAQVGRELRYETAQPPLPQEPNIGPGGMPPEISIGPDGFVFGTPAALGERAFPEERRYESATSKDLKSPYWKGCEGPCCKTGRRSSWKSRAATAPRRQTAP